MSPKSGTGQTAVADLIDNSIAAKATRILIFCQWSQKESYITLLDNGTGMNERELVRAMTLGSKSPTELRSAGDLGRFGMGLKTASFSQCRQLTVASKQSRVLSIREWDLDYIQQAKDWLLKKNTDEKGDELVKKLLIGDTGTCVIWRNLDRIIDFSAAEGKGKEHFLEVMESIENHLAMVFHRYLARKRLKISINGHDIKPWDPFMVKHDFTQEYGEDIASAHGLIRVHGYVLPHRSRLTENEFLDAGGPNGWNGQQGLYVYKNDRLLVAGGWAGLGLRAEDQFNLARVAIDIPLNSDAAWHLDIKKSRVRPPNEVRGRLKKIAEIMQERSRHTYRSKGRILGRKISGTFAPVWKEQWKGSKLGYHINRDHPVVSGVISRLASEDLKLLLRLLEETLPLENIAFYLADSPNARQEPFEEKTDTTDFKSIVALLDQIISTTKLPLSLLESTLTEIDPFNRYPEKVLEILRRGKADDGETAK